MMDGVMCIFPIAFCCVCMCLCTCTCMRICVRWWLLVGYMGWYDGSWQMMILVCVGEREKNVVCRSGRKKEK